METKYVSKYLPKEAIGSYRTYEEWKLEYHILEMGDPRFLPYLWGMETPSNLTNHA